jgi:hypothetical protein
MVYDSIGEPDLMSIQKSELLANPSTDIAAQQAI